jgi:hypothetical protein
MTIEQLKSLYEIACMQYIEMFEKKQGMRFEYWVGNLVGEVAMVGDYTLNFSDIVYDINSNQPKRKILKWQNESIDRVMVGKQTMNYYSYSKGLTYKKLDK